MQYVIAEWDYVAEGESELSFKEGDRIRLLEKHNDDWWEGELDDKIGFFPANRARQEDDKDNDSRSSRDITSSGSGGFYSLAPPLPSQPNPSRSLIDLTTDFSKASQSLRRLGNGNNPLAEPTRSLLAREEEIERNLPFGWKIAFDDKDTIYYFNEFTGETSWDLPGSASTLPAATNLESAIIEPGAFLSLGAEVIGNRGMSPVSFDEPDEDEGAGGDRDDELAAMVAQRRADQGLLAAATAPEATVTMEDSPDSSLGNGDYDVSQLQLDQLPAEWVHRQGYAQMKMKAERSEDSNKLAAWKMYWIVLCSGFLLFYKDSKEKLKRSGKSTMPVFCHDLAICRIETAQRFETKRKNVFIVTLPDKIKLFVQMQSPEETSMWLDGVMRDLVARREGGGQPEIVKLLHLQASDHDKLAKPNLQKKPQSATSPGKDKPTSTPARLAPAPPAAAIVAAPAKKEKEGTRIGFRKPHQHQPEPRKIGGWLRKVPKPGSHGSEAKNNDAVAEKDLVFGGLLNVTAAGVPEIVEMCIKAVDERGLTSVGIYRLSGPSATIQKYRAAVNAGDPIDLNNEQDINAITGLLKLYFRELRNPLLTYELYDHFLDAGRVKAYDDRMFQIKGILQMLPPPYYTTLRQLLQHLSRVASNSEENKMEASNLAIVFSPNLLRPIDDDALESMRNAGSTNTVVEALILQWEWFFEEEDDAAEEGQHDEKEEVEEKGMQAGPFVDIAVFDAGTLDVKDGVGKTAELIKPDEVLN